MRALDLLDAAAVECSGATGATDAGPSAVRCLQALLSVLDAPGTVSIDIVAALQALATLVDAGALQSVEPARTVAACRAVVNAAARRLLAPDAEPEARRGGLAVLDAVLRSSLGGSAPAEGATTLECATVAWRACVHACAHGGLPAWLQREAEAALTAAQRAMTSDGGGTSATASERGGVCTAVAEAWAAELGELLRTPPAALPRGRLLALRLLRAHACEPTALTTPASRKLLMSRVLPELLEAVADAAQPLEEAEEASQLAIELVPTLLRERAAGLAPCPPPAPRQYRFASPPPHLVARACTSSPRSCSRPALSAHGARNARGARVVRPAQ